MSTSFSRRYAFSTRAEVRSRPRWGLLRRFLGISIGCGMLAATVLGFSPQRALDSEVKAAYLFNFGRFVRWPSLGPAADTGPFGVCVLGDDPFGSVLDKTLEGEQLDGRPVVARRIAKLEDTAGCRILFAGALEEKLLPSLLQHVQGTATLTVSDMPHFTDRGGMVQFVSAGNRVRFEVNLTTVEQADLVLSSDLLRVAMTVKHVGAAGE